MSQMTKTLRRFLNCSPSEGQDKAGQERMQQRAYCVLYFVLEMTRVTSLPQSTYCECLQSMTGFQGLERYLSQQSMPTWSL